MRERIPSLDGLRGVSILLVLLGHLTGTTNFPRALEFLGGLANIGVGIFFVMSGFLITTLLMREKTKTGRISLRNFYVRRILRIFPVAYLYIAVVALLSYLGLVRLRPYDLACAVSYLMDYHHDHAWILGHFWSLTVEEQFYLLWPAAVVILGFRRSSIAALSYLALTPLSRIALAWFIPWWPPAIRLPQGADSIVTGCLLALSFEWLRNQRVFAYRFFSLLLVPAVAFRLHLWNVHREVYGLGYLISLLIALLIFRSVVVPDDFVGRVLNSSALSFVGVLSYSIYVWQQMFLLYSPEHRSVFPWNIMATFAVATLSYYLIERPFLKLKARFTRRQPEPAKQVIVSAI